MNVYLVQQNQYFTEIDMGKFKKENLVNMAINKINQMKVKELEAFLGLTGTLKVDDLKKDFKLEINYSCHCYNNTSFGRISGGGELYRRAIVTIRNQEFNPLELEISVRYLVPSGYGDGNTKIDPVSYILKDKDLLGMKRHGSRLYLESLFKIPYRLEHEDSIPYTLKG